jgi:hypothetical protein
MSDLFWNTKTRSVTKAEAERLASPEETGRRLVVALRAWLGRALEELPPEARDWYRVDLDPPEWLDPGYPHLAVGECSRLVHGIPDAAPGWIDWTPEQARAVAVLHAARAAVKATERLPAPEALLLLEKALNLGHALARAHIRPWEATYTRYKDAQTAKASLAAEARWSSGDRGRLTTIIKRLATKTEWGEYPEPSELWLELFGDMDSAGLSPCDTGEAYTYGNGETITKDAFRKRVQRLRQQK